VEIRIAPRPGILDPEGETIARALAQLGHKGVRQVRAGRLLRLQIEAPGPQAAREAAIRMCEELIANPVIERYEVNVQPAGLEPAAP